MTFAIVLFAILLIILFWIGKIFYAVEKGLQETIKGMNSIEERLAALEKSQQDD